MDNDSIICNCMQISKAEILEAVNLNDLKTVDDVCDATEAGTVCGSCHDDIEELLGEV